MEGRDRDATTLTGEVKLGSRLKIVDPFIAELSRRARSAAKPHIEAARLAAARPSGIEHRIVARLVIPRHSPGKATGLVPVIPIACGRGEDCGYQVDIFVSGADQCRIERDIISAELRSLFRSEEHTSELQSLMRISYA